MTRDRWAKLKSDPEEYALYKTVKSLKDAQRRQEKPWLNSVSCKRYYAKNKERILNARKAKRLQARLQRAQENQ